MRKKLCLVMCALTLSMLIACGENETTTTQPESVTEAVDVTINEEAVEIPSEEVMEEVSEVIVAEPAIAYTDDIAFTVSSSNYTHITVDIKTLNGYTIETVDPFVADREVCRFIAPDGTVIEYNIYDSWMVYASNIEQMDGYECEEVTLTNADGKEVIFLYAKNRGGYGWQHLTILIDAENELYLSVSISPTEKDENGVGVMVNPEDYLEYTRDCYYNVNLN